MNKDLTLAKAMKQHKLEHSHLAYIVLALKGDDRLIAMMLIGTGLNLDEIMDIRFEHMCSDDCAITTPDSNAMYLLPNVFDDEILACAKAHHGIYADYVNELHTHECSIYEKGESPYLFGNERDAVKNNFIHTLKELSKRRRQLKGLDVEQLRISFFKFYHEYGIDVISLNGLEKISGYGKNPVKESQKATYINNLHEAMTNMRLCQGDFQEFDGDETFRESPIEHIVYHFAETLMDNAYFVDDYVFASDLLHGYSAPPQTVSLAPSNPRQRSRLSVGP